MSAAALLGGAAWTGDGEDLDLNGDAATVVLWIELRYDVRRQAGKTERVLGGAG